MSRSRNPVSRRSRWGVPALCALVLCSGAWAQTRSFDIPAGDMKAALDAYAAQSGLQLVYKVEDLRGLVSPGLRRAASAEEALQALIRGSVLSVRRDVSGALVIFTPAAAAPRAPGGADTSSDTVVVTANRRREPAREVSMQLGVMPADELIRSGAGSLADYLSREPGANLNSWGGPGYGSLTIRGVTTGNDTSATVGIYVDEVAVGSSTPFLNGAIRAFDMGLLDLQQVELLRGPQGTLYGASAMGGVLKYVTVEPDSTELAGRVRLGASATHQGGTGSTVSGVVNIPLSRDAAGLRVAAFRNKSGGTVDTVGGVTARDIDAGTTSGARASLLLTPRRDLRIRLTATGQDIRRDGLDSVDYGPATGQLVLGDLKRQLELREPYDAKVRILAAEVEADLGWARLNSITSTQQVRSNVLGDMSSAYVPLLASFGLVVQTAAADVRVDGRRTAQELRLTSRPGRGWDWLLGVYVSEESGTNEQAVPTTMPGGMPGPNLATAKVDTRYRERAAFGNLTWKLDERITLNGGLRVATNRQRTTVETDGPLVGGAQQLADNSRDTSTTYLLTGRYALTPVSNVFVRSASAYRPGGPNPVLRDPVTGQPVAPNTFEPDTLTSHEAGYKGELLDRRLSLSAALFDIRWKNVQQYTAVNGVNVIVSAGRAHLQGLELSATWRPARDWKAVLGAAFTEAKLSADAPGLGAKAGARLPNSPRLAASLDLSHDFTLWGRPAYAGWTQRYAGQRNSGYEGSATAPNHRLPAYTLTDLRAGVDFKGFGLELYLRNAFDERAQLAANSGVSALGGPVWISHAQPRTLGAALNLPF